VSAQDRQELAALLAGVRDRADWLEKTILDNRGRAIWNLHQVRKMVADLSIVDQVLNGAVQMETFNSGQHPENP
jgi:hypothetical protein